MVQQTNRFTTAIRKLLSIKGEEHNIGFGVHLEDERVEYSFLKQEQLFVQTQEVTTTAAQVCLASVFNPLGSGVLGVLQTCFVTSDTVGIVYQLGFAAAAGPGALSSMQPRDLRWRPGLGGSLRQFAGVGGAAGFSGLYTQLVSLAAHAVLDFMALPGRVPPVVIPPGFQVYISMSAVAAAVTRVTMAGYERPLESGELI